MNAQDKKIGELEKDGYRFSNWIRSDENFAGQDDSQTAVMKKKTKFGNTYLEVNPDGSVN